MSHTLIINSLMLCWVLVATDEDMHQAHVVVDIAEKENPLPQEPAESMAPAPAESMDDLPVGIEPMRESMRDDQL